MSSLPVVPPRPSRATAASPPAASTSPAPPTVPARPVRNRSKSPLPQSDAAAEPEGGVKLETSIPPANETSSHRASSPEQKRKIDPDLDLHHPMAVRPPGEMPKGEMPKDDHIPEIGQRVPMLDFAGDVQAPSPFPEDSRSLSRTKRRSQHTPNLPPENGPVVVGDYGAYPSTSKVYRQTGAYSLSHDDLTKSVMQANGAGVATTPGLEGVPDEEIGYAATDEMASRNVTPQVTPGGAAGQKLPAKSPLTIATSLDSENDTAHQLPNLDEAGNDSHGIYGKGAQSNVSSTSLTMPTSGRHTPWEDFQDEHAEGTPILASDEAGKYPVWGPPAISPKLTGQEIRRPPSSNRSRTSPTVLAEEISDPPSPIKEHIPLFPEGAAPPPKMPQRPKLGEKQHSSQGFPSKDVWEDAPESTHVTYEVHEEEEQKNDPDYYDPREAKKKEEEAAKLASEQSKDTTSPPPPPARPVRSTATDENSPVSPDASKHAPGIPERPKPAIPPRPTKKVSDPSSAGSTSHEDAKSPPPTKPKPVIPGRVGGGIAALRANFMSDLNSRLSKGPVAPKKEEPPEAEPEPKAQEPLEDVRKTRARGPAKRKPTPAAAVAAPASSSSPVSSGPKLTFSSIITVYSIGDDYEVTFDETKFDDEPSKVARPMGEKVIEQLKGGDDDETSKQAPAAATVPEVQEEPTKEEPTKEEPVEEKKETPTAPAVEETAEESTAGPVDTIKEAATKVVETVAPSSTPAEEDKESKPETAVEEKAVVA
ncbi:hypothetical protein Dda_7808 [Drechslerella dactyloides]|uniref:Altered inheritance of mitochondria protein 21 n=1 Tax=Drechslerella dactyloides TaxID=74499 RepID=A0AAD6IQZ2_DREDA|nr:hypothetical protein Dda_7808 [Drechslerella dactyloides]